MKTILTLLFLLFAVPAWGAQLVVSWIDNSDNERGFTLERAPGLDATEGFVVIANIVSDEAQSLSTGTRVGYADTALQPATGYTYRVAAYNETGASSFSPTASGTTAAALPSLPVVPSAPDVVPEPEPTPYTPPEPVVSLPAGQSLRVVAIP